MIHEKHWGLWQDIEDFLVYTDDWLVACTIGGRPSDGELWRLMGWAKRREERDPTIHEVRNRYGMLTDWMGFEIDDSPLSRSEARIRQRHLYETIEEQITAWRLDEQEMERLL